MYIYGSHKRFIGNKRGREFADKQDTKSNDIVSLETEISPIECIHRGQIPISNGAVLIDLDPFFFQKFTGLAAQEIHNFAG